MQIYLIRTIYKYKKTREKLLHMQLIQQWELMIEKKICVV